MSAIGPGDWVECVNHPAENQVFSIEVGQIYRVLEVGVYESLPQDASTQQYDGLPVVFVYPRRAQRRGEFGQWWVYNGHLVSRFRPIYRPKADLIESLKAPAKREGVPA